MKQYPVLLEDIWDNIRSLTRSAKKLEERVAGLEATESEHFKTFNTEHAKTTSQITSLETQIEQVFTWRTGHETEIRDQKNNVEKLIDRIGKKIGSLNRDLDEAKREHSVRMDAIENAAGTNSEIRDGIGKRLEKLTTEFETYTDCFSHKQRQLASRLEDEEATSVLFKERLDSMDLVLEKAVEDIKVVDVNRVPLENSLNLLRKDITVIERTVTETEHRVVELEAFKDITKQTTENQERRLSDLEQDDRVNSLEALYPRVSTLEILIKEQKRTTTDANLLLEKKIDILTKEVANVHPKFWELLKEAESMKEDLAGGKESQLEFWTELEATQGHLGCVIEDSFHLRHSLESIQEQLNQTVDNQSNDNQKTWKYIEDTLNSVPRYYHLDEIRKSVEEGRKALEKEIEESKHTVKFELLHDPSPQVDQLKQYLKQQDEGHADLKQRVQLLEQSVKSQYLSVQHSEARLSQALKKFPSAVVVEELNDIPKVKERVQQMNQSVQSMQEQILQLKKQTTDAERASYSRCSSLRSSFALNTSAMNFLKKHGTKTLRRKHFQEQDSFASASQKQTPPRTAESEHSQTQDDGVCTRSPSPCLEQGLMPL